MNNVLLVGLIEEDLKKIGLLLAILVYCPKAGVFLFELGGDDSYFSFDKAKWKRFVELTI